MVHPSDSIGLLMTLQGGHFVQHDGTSFETAPKKNYKAALRPEFGTVSRYKILSLIFFT